MARLARQFYEFGPFRIDPAERQLLRDGQVVPLRPKVFDTLLVLVKNSGRMLTKDEMMKEVWADTVVEEANLTTNIYSLRKTLGSSSDNNQYIETIPWRGYRFVADVREVREGLPDLIVEERTRSRVVIDEQVSEPAAELEAIAIDKSIARRREAGSGPSRRLSPLALALGGVVTLAIALISYFWIVGGSKGNLTDPPIKTIEVLPFKSISPE